MISRQLDYRRRHRQQDGRITSVGKPPRSNVPRPFINSPSSEGQLYIP